MTAVARLLGLRFARLGVAETAAWIAARPAGASFGYVVTPNADHLVRVDRDPSLRPIYEHAVLCLMDSRVVSRLAWLLGLPAPPVVTDSDVTEALMTAHLHPDERVTIVGLRAEDVAALRARIGIAPPNHHEPPMGFDRDPAAMRAAVEFVLAHPARLVFLAVGSPRQEKLAAALAATGRARGTGLCIGASLAFLAGTQRRAPRWVRAAGLEWLFRLAGDPVRLWRRYLRDCPVILWLLARDRWLMRTSRSAVLAKRPEDQGFGHVPFQAATPDHR